MIKVLNCKNLIFLVLLASAIALSPSFPAGNLPDGKIIEIRIEDILIVILGIIWLAEILISGRTKLQRPPLFLPILVWLSIGFISLLTNWIFLNVGFERGFFYFLKELEFFVFYFYVFYHLRGINSVKFIISTWLVLLAINVFYVIYQSLLNLEVGEYGAAALCEWGVFPTGSFFLISFIFLFNIYLYYFLNLNISSPKKAGLAVLAMSPIIGVFGSASKTNFLGLIIVLFLTFIFLILKRKDFRPALIFGLISFLIIITFIVFLIGVGSDERWKQHRLLYIFSFENVIHNYITGRMDVIDRTYEDASERKSFLMPFIGFGKGYVTEAHNQFLRNFIETGLIGSIIFLYLIWVILRKSFLGLVRNKEPLSVGLSAGLFIATLIMLFFSFATEPFIVVKPSEVYWFFAAITMFILVQKKNYVQSELSF